jgi:hypothetical protein
MKKIISLLLFIILLSGCLGKDNQEKISPQNDSSVYFPYASRYATDFEKGDPRYLEMVLDFWKEYETGNVKKTAKNFADTILMVLPEGFFSGQKDSVLASFKKTRDKYSIVQCHLDTWMPARINGKDNWVFIWGWQERTDKNGKLEAPVLHEVWRINKKGKIDFMQQYLTHYVRDIFMER